MIMRRDEAPRPASVMMVVFLALIALTIFGVSAMVSNAAEIPPTYADLAEKVAQLEAELEAERDRVEDAAEVALQVQQQQQQSEAAIEEKVERAQLRRIEAARYLEKIETRKGELNR